MWDRATTLQAATALQHGPAGIHQLQVNSLPSTSGLTALGSNSGVSDPTLQAATTLCPGNVSNLSMVLNVHRNHKVY